MAVWTDELKKKAIEAYKNANPTPESSIEIIKEIAEDLEQTANGVRMILVKAGVYIKKDPAAEGKATKEGGGTRVSKETQINALRDVIKDNGLPLDEEIIEKLTGKAAAYFVSVIKQAVAEE